MVAKHSDALDSRIIPVTAAGFVVAWWFFQPVGRCSNSNPEKSIYGSATAQPIGQTPQPQRVEDRRLVDFASAVLGFTSIRGRPVPAVSFSAPAGVAAAPFHGFHAPIIQRVARAQFFRSRRPRRGHPPTRASTHRANATAASNSVPPVFPPIRSIQPKAASGAPGARSLPDSPRSGTPQRASRQVRSLAWLDTASAQRGR